MKKVIAIVLCLVLVLGAFAGCGGTDKKEPQKVSLKVWGAQESQELLNDLTKKFAAANPDVEYTFEFGVVGEGDAKTKILEDPAAAADVFAFAHDQINALVDAGTLAKIGGANETAVKNDNIAPSVGAATYKDGLYAYPMTADNGYFLYYNKAKVTDPSSFEAISKSAAAAKAKYIFKLTDSWYLASFFFGAGCELYNKDGKVICNFNNENGVKAGQAIFDMAKDPNFKTGDDDQIKAGFKDGSVVAAVSGSWNAKDIKEILGENYAATKLPTVTIDGKQVQLGSFGGFKLMGVNSASKYPAEAHKLAAFLTNEASQAERFAKQELGPSNKKIAESKAVKDNVALSALAMQSSFAIAQSGGIDNYWAAAEAFGKDAIAKKGGSVKEMLDKMVSQIVG